MTCTLNLKCAELKCDWLWRLKRWTVIGGFLPLTELMAAVDQDLHAVKTHHTHQYQTNRTELEEKQRTMFSLMRFRHLKHIKRFKNIISVISDQM